ncbi:MAG: T9SS type A sorting domain-containing protein [Dysgonamonadaceae bacterium]|jgi:hypothetical protein|nr:T9SS type A sorting domain-containing protein [Dysgonamonadaceae bacterium]
MKKNLILFFLSFSLSLQVAFPAEQPEHVAYLYAYFSGDESRSDDQQVYFAISKDGLRWTDLNVNNPVLSSTLGDKRVRDPYIIRSHEGDKFFLIATDLDIRASKYGGNWGNMSTKGSTSLLIWESTDLVNWSEPRMVDVASSIGAGCAWAPEAIYDETAGEYLVYWSSRVAEDNYALFRIYVSKTKDFHTFTQPEVFVETPLGCIDASIFKVGDTCYRLIKDDTQNYVSLSSSKVLLDYSNETGLGNSYTHIPNTELENHKGGYEGATMFQFLGENKWCVLVDEYVGAKRGYIPFVSTDISQENSLTLLANGTYIMPTGAKHGTVITVSQKEYDDLIDKWGVRSPEAQTGRPVLEYDFNETLSGRNAVDKSGNGYDAQLYGNAQYISDAEKGQVLYVDKNSSYLEFPNGFFDGRDTLTVSMDVKPMSDDFHHFVFTIGTGTAKYFFLRIRDNETRMAITTQSNGKEYDILKSGSYKGKWMNVKMLFEGHTMSLYIDNELIQKRENVRSINDFGKGLNAYIGKSFYSDPYFTGYFDNIKIYNRALSKEEIEAEKTQTSINRMAKEKNEFVIFPNPVNDFIRIKIPGEALENTLTISSLTGESLIKQQFASSGEIALNVSGIPEGVYFCSVQNGRNCSTYKFIKN